VCFIYSRTAPPLPIRSLCARVRSSRALPKRAAVRVLILFCCGFFRVCSRCLLPIRVFLGDAPPPVFVLLTKPRRRRSFLIEFSRKSRCRCSVSLRQIRPGLDFLRLSPSGSCSSRSAPKSSILRAPEKRRRGPDFFFLCCSFGPACAMGPRRFPRLAPKVCRSSELPILLATKMRRRLSGFSHGGRVLRARAGRSLLPRCHRELALSFVAVVLSLVWRQSSPLRSKHQVHLLFSVLQSTSTWACDFQLSVLV
jgi:hypothetical protein